MNEFGDEYEARLPPERCGNCRFKIWTECHRREPTISGGSTFPMWPKVSEGDWCGEWEKLDTQSGVCQK